MEKHFGFGDYERVDVEVRTSTKDLRYRFLKTLVDRKGNWISNLVRIANFEMLPQSVRETNDEHHIFFLFFVYVFGKNPFGWEIRPEFIDTPLNRFFSYLELKSDEISKFESEVELRIPAREALEIKIKALEKLIPNWKTLKTDAQAQSFCSSLEAWAKKYNLNEDWCLDFVLKVLHNFKVRLHFEPEKIKDEETSFNKAGSYYWHYDWMLREALHAGLKDFYFDTVTITIWTDTESPNFPPFYFQHGEFDVAPVTWFPDFTRRIEFVHERLQNYSRRVEAIKELSLHPRINKEFYTNKLNEYCDEIEMQLSQNLPNQPIFPYTVKHLDLVLYSSLWNPKKVRRETFIKKFIKELKKNFDKCKPMAESLKTMKDGKFEEELYLYCNKTEKLMPPNYERTPTKYGSDKHFDWLVDFQVTPFKEYKEIAEEIEIEKRPTVSAIKKAIKRLSNIIGITLRKPPRTGRPKGVQETQKRRREKKIKVGTL